MDDTIRLAEADETPAVEAIVVAAYTPYVAEIGCTPGPLLDDYGALIGARQVYVLVRAGLIDGVLVLVPEAEAMLLDNVALRPTLKGAGHGRKLLAFAEDAARAAGYGSIRLYTHERMAANLALYARIGYVETHRGEEKGLRRVYMTKALEKKCHLSD